MPAVSRDQGITIIAEVKIVDFIETFGFASL